MLMDIGFAQQLLNKQGQLSYIAVFHSGDKGNKDTQANWQKLIGDQGQWISNNQSTDLGSLTDSFHLNLTAMSLLAFLVGLFIAYNGVKYSLLKRNRLLVQIQQAGVAPSIVFSALLVELTILVTIGASLGFCIGHAAQPLVASDRSTDSRTTLWCDTAARHLAMAMVGASPAAHISRHPIGMLAAL